MAAPPATRSPVDRMEREALSRTITELMARQGISQSDLARAIWGTTVDPRGRDVARNRDRISNYVRGTQMPEPSTLKKIADVLGVEPTDLVPSLAVKGAAHATPDINMTVVAGRPDMALLTVNKMLPLGVAVKVLALLAQADGQDGDGR